MNSFQEVEVISFDKSRIHDYIVRHIVISIKLAFYKYFLNACSNNADECIPYFEKFWKEFK